MHIWDKSWKHTRAIPSKRLKHPPITLRHWAKFFEVSWPLAALQPGSVSHFEVSTILHCFETDSYLKRWGWRTSNLPYYIIVIPYQPHHQSNHYIISRLADAAVDGGDDADGDGDGDEDDDADDDDDGDGDVGEDDAHGDDDDDGDGDGDGDGDEDDDDADDDDDGDGDGDDDGEDDDHGDDDDDDDDDGDGDDDDVVVDDDFDDSTSMIRCSMWVGDSISYAIPEREANSGTVLLPSRNAMLTSSTQSHQHTSYNMIHKSSKQTNQIFDCNFISNIMSCISQ